ncbi:hypothetical protein VNI00_014794 [Paramarasmius palmivorus]|uniref:GST N-terminal domain-containing protein n=1 Tax=Paramarasmius palmivorus TaxID=297713 RepID=A0AAW0BRN2_9AGAR
MITLYDLGPSLLEDQTLGLSTPCRKIILILRYKDIPYDHRFISLSEIESTAKSVGAPPTTTREDGAEKYTVPFLYDSTHGRAVSDSYLIAQYLDEAYPDTPKVFPKGTKALQSLAVDALEAKSTSLIPVIRPKMYRQMTPKMFEELNKQYGPAPELSTEELTAQLAKAKTMFDELKKSFGNQEELYVMGDRPIYVDFSLASLVLTLRVYYGSQSKEWGEAKNWAAGRIGNICEGILALMRV